MTIEEKRKLVATKKYRDRIIESITNKLEVCSFSLTSQKGKTMFRLWGKIWKDNHMLQDTVICDETDDTRTHKIFHALDSICYEFDLSKPIWLDSNIKEFQKHDKTRFYSDNFVESIEFDYLEIQIIEE